MVIFFLVVGLEIKREILIGELASFRKAILPVAAAVGGMAVLQSVRLVRQTPSTVIAIVTTSLPSYKGHFPTVQPLWRQPCARPF